MSLGRALLLIVAQLLLVFIVGFGLAARLVPDPEHRLAPSVPLFALLIPIVAIGVVGFVWFGSVKQPGRSWRELGWHTDNLGRQLLLGFGGGVLCVVTVCGLARVAGMNLEEIVDGLTSVSAGQRAVYVLIGVQAAFVEESLFRGNLQGALEKRVGLTAGVVVMAIIFALYHLARPLGLAGKFGVGLVTGTLRGHDRTLFGPALAHAMVWFVAGGL